MMKALTVILSILLFSLCASAQTTVSGKTVMLLANASDVTPNGTDLECGVGYVQFLLSGNPIGPIILPDGTDNYKYAWDSTNTPDGDYVLTATATDRAGTGIPPHTNCDGSAPNTGTSGAILIKILNHPPTDVTPPSITINPPVPQIVTNKNQPINAIAFDAGGIANITLKINNQVKAFNSGSQALNYVWNTSPYKGTKVTIEVSAKDNAGNAGTSSTTVSVRK